jgi:hypothetical protein
MLGIIRPTFRCANAFPSAFQPLDLSAAATALHDRVNVPVEFFPAATGLVIFLADHRL